MPDVEDEQNNAQKLHSALQYNNISFCIEGL